MEHHSESLISDPRAWVGAAFIVFFLLFGAKLWKVLAKTLDARGLAVRLELDEAARLRREGEAMLRDAETRRTAAIAEAKQMLETARTEAARVAEAARAEAEATASRRERMALDRIAAAEKAAVDEVRTRAADLATTAAAGILASTMTDSDNARLIDSGVQGIGAALAPRRAA